MNEIDSSMKIAIMIPSLRPGGAEKVMIKVAGALAAKGSDVDLVVGDARGTLFSGIPKNVRVIDLRKKRVLYLLPAIVRYLRRERPAILISTMSHLNIVAIAARYISRVHTKIVVREATTPSKVIGNSKRRSGSFINPIMKILYPLSSGIIAVSEGVKRDLMDNYRVRETMVRTIVNPVCSKELHEKSRVAIEHPWYRDLDVPIIVMVGRLDIAKDYPTALKAFSLLRKKRRVRMIIMGEGPERGNLEIAIKRLGIETDVLMMGFVENPYPYMAGASVYLLTSRREGMPNALLEAVALGVPFVATDCPSGPREILTYAYGQLSPVGDADDICNALHNVIERKDHYTASEEYLQRFDIDYVASQYLSLATDIVSA